MKTLARPDDRLEIVRRLKTLRPDRPRRWGRMTAPQAVCHMSDAFRMLTGDKPVRRVANPVERTLLKWVALALPLPWPPGLIMTTPEIDQLQGGTRPGAFAVDVAALASLLDRIAAEPGRLAGRAHPIFGRLSAAEWLRWGYLHTDHHLRQFGA